MAELSLNLPISVPPVSPAQPAAVADTARDANASRPADKSDAQQNKRFSDALDNARERDQQAQQRLSRQNKQPQKQEETSASQQQQAAEPVRQPASAHNQPTSSNEKIATNANEDVAAVAASESVAPVAADAADAVLAVPAVAVEPEAIAAESVSDEDVFAQLLTNPLKTSTQNAAVIEVAPVAEGAVAEAPLSLQPEKPVLPTQAADAALLNVNKEKPVQAANSNIPVAIEGLPEQASERADTVIGRLFASFTQLMRGEQPQPQTEAVQPVAVQPVNEVVAGSVIEASLADTDENVVADAKSQAQQVSAAATQLTQSTQGEAQVEEAQPEEAVKVSPLHAAQAKAQATTPAETAAKHDAANGRANADTDSADALSTLNTGVQTQSAAAVKSTADTANADADSGGDTAADAQSLLPLNANAQAQPGRISAADASFMRVLEQMQQPSPAEQVTAHVRAASKNGETRFHIQLTPVELGKVEIRMDVAPDGATKLSITADNPRALEMLKSEARVLERMLMDVGLKADAGSLSFNLRGEQQGQGQFTNNQQHGHGYPKQKEDALDELLAVASPQQYVLADADGLDIRI